MHDGIQDRAVEAVDFLIDLFSLDPGQFGVGEQPVDKFVNCDDIGLRRLRDVVG